MPEDDVLRPVQGAEAFTRGDYAAALSQAAILLASAWQLQGVSRDRLLALVPEFEEFVVPRFPRRPKDIDRNRATAFLKTRYGTRIDPQLFTGARLPTISGELADMAGLVFSEKETALGGMALLELCLRHSVELTRVAAAASYTVLGVVQEPDVLGALVAGLRSNDALVRELASQGLSRAAPDHPDVKRLMEQRRGPGGEPGHTALLVHGTFARGDTWWQPGGDFHAYLSQVRPDLYAAADRFDWSGGYSDKARALGASDLGAWVQGRGLNRPTLFTHSHGGSIAMLASRAGLDMGQLVLLSCPVHMSKYKPDFKRVGKAVSIRVKLDLAILLDRGGQRFHDKRIEENVLPVWFRHSATHDPSVWQRFNVPAML